VSALIILSDARAAWPEFLQLTPVLSRSQVDGKRTTFTTGAMGFLRSLRRTNPLMLILTAILFFGFITFILSPSSADSASLRLRKASAASNPLSPPTSPFRKSSNPPGKRQIPPVVHYHLNNVTSSSDPIGQRETILILTPLARFYPEYWQNLLNLSYPHELITLGFIIPKTREGNAATASLQEHIQKTQLSGPEKKRFASIIIERQDFDTPIMSQDEHERHKMENQKLRRAAMSRARNSLLFTTLGPSTSWVLWLDSDIIETPPSLIQDLAAHDKAIIVPNCFQRFKDPKTGKMKERPYDFNSWQTSDVAQKLGDKMGPDDILLEGYAEMATYRTLLAYLVQEDGDVNAEVPLDGVGGTALLVKADVHRDGAMFPPFPFYHLIETEGFAKMARRLGWAATGLPNYKVYTQFKH
jgi:mannan polymerase complexes MNN9 subunit